MPTDSTVILRGQGMALRFHAGLRCIPLRQGTSHPGHSVFTKFKALVMATLWMVEEAAGMSSAEAASAERFDRHWSQIYRLGGKALVRHMEYRTLDHPVGGVSVPGLWPALAACLFAEALRGAHVGVLTGPQELRRLARWSP